VSQGFPRAALAFDELTRPADRLAEMPWQALQLPLARSGEVPTLDFTELDIFVLVINAQTGISQAMQMVWQQAQERQIPRILLVQNLEDGDIDFDDITLIGSRILENLATPFLVLHGETGNPIGLISLQELKVFDYSKSELDITEADQDLIALVSDFRSEYLEDFAALGNDAFEEGIYAVALPLSAIAGFGFAELQELISRLPRH
jgi:hypothetical protein